MQAQRTETCCLLVIAQTDNIEMYAQCVVGLNIGWLLDLCVHSIIGWHFILESIEKHIRILSGNKIIIMHLFE